MANHINHLLDLQVKRKRIQKFLNGSIAVLVGGSSVILIVLEPQYLKFVGMVALMAVIGVVAAQAMEFDPDEPDGGENKAKANGCFFTIVLMVVGLWTISSLIAAIMATEHYEFAIGYGVVLGVAVWLYPKIAEFTAKKYPEIWRLEYECGICETGCYKDGKYICPVCDFISTSQKHYGLRQHFTQTHADTAKNLRIFGKICSSCESRTNSRKKSKR
jgi:hypothetical protein